MKKIMKPSLCPLPFYCYFNQLHLIHVIKRKVCCLTNFHYLKLYVKPLNKIRSVH